VGINFTVRKSDCCDRRIKRQRKRHDPRSFCQGFTIFRKAPSPSMEKTSGRMISGLRSLFWNLYLRKPFYSNDSVFNNIGYGLQGASAALVIEAAKVGQCMGIH